MGSVGGLVSFCSKALSASDKRDRRRVTRSEINSHSSNTAAIITAPSTPVWTACVLKAWAFSWLCCVISSAMVLAIECRCSATFTWA